MRFVRKNRLVLFGGVAVLVLLAGCAMSPSAQNDGPSYGRQLFNDEDTGVVLYFTEKEAGADDSYRSRWFVNKSYLHMTDTRAPKDFLLFDRATQTIYSTNSNDKSIFVIKPRLITVPPPIALDYVEISQPSAAIPKVSDKQATHYRYEANGQHCYDAVTLEADFLPEVVGALMEYRTVLAGEHAGGLSRIPVETQDACDLSLNIFHATKHMQNGLPIREWDQRGFQRFLQDYSSKFKLDPEAFKLPEGYTQYSIGE